jgi:hypothetical protein
VDLELKAAETRAAGAEESLVGDTRKLAAEIRAQAIAHEQTVVSMHQTVLLLEVRHPWLRAIYGLFYKA